MAALATGAVDRSGGRVAVGGEDYARRRAGDSVKRPSFQFYPGDWLHSPELRTCSLAARGLWMDMLCYMHQAEPYGYLKVGQKVILPTTLARMVGSTGDEIEVLLVELQEAQVFSRDPDGCMFSRRMIRDEEVRLARAAGGVKGGNPDLKRKGKVNQPTPERLTSNDNQPPTPSSSSSSSEEPNEVVVAMAPDPSKIECLALVNRHFPKWVFSGEKYKEFLDYEDNLPWALLLKAVQTTMAAGKTSLPYCIGICEKWAGAELKTLEDVDAYEKRRETGRKPQGPQAGSNTATSQPYMEGLDLSHVKVGGQ